MHTYYCRWDCWNHQINLCCVLAELPPWVLGPPLPYSPAQLYSFVALSLTLLLYTPGTVFLLFRISTSVNRDGSEGLISKPTGRPKGPPGHTPWFFVCSGLSPSVRLVHLGKWEGCLMATSVWTEFPSSFHWTGQVAAALCTHGQLPEPTWCLNMFKSRPGSPFHPQFQHETCQF